MSSSNGMAYPLSQQNSSNNLDIQSTTSSAYYQAQANFSAAPLSVSANSSSHLALHSVRQYSTQAPLIATRPFEFPPANHKIVDLEASTSNESKASIELISTTNKDSPANGKSLYLNCDILSPSSQSNDKGRK